MNNRRSLLKAVSLAAVSPLAVHSALQPNRVSAAANEQIRLGVIGIGPRCRYVLGGMLKHADVSCITIADVQAARRDEGKKLALLTDLVAGCETLDDVDLAAAEAAARALGPLPT